MEAKSCFNCRRVGCMSEIFSLHPNQRQPLERYISYNGLKALFGGQRPSICADCVYDRLQTCQKCTRKIPLCFYDIEEWFKSSSERVCQDCTAIQATQVAFRNGLMLKDALKQCLKCSMFKCIYSFLSIFNFKEFDVVCRECVIHQDIQQYHMELKARYAESLSLSPSLTHVETDVNVIDKQMLSYARVLMNGSKSIEDEVGEKRTPDVLQPSHPQEVRSFFQTTMNVDICWMVLDAFRESLHELEEKTKVELKILQQDPSFWQVVLRNKLMQVTTKFSTQATNRTSFHDAEIRAAYIGTYCCSHASLVHAAFNSGCFPPLLEFIQNCKDSGKPLHVCCIGAGPGSEVLGLHKLLPANTEWYLMDNCDSWCRSAKLLLQHVPGIKFNYGTFDITSKLHHFDVFKKATFYAFVKFVSAIHFLKKSTSRFRELLRLTPVGSIFLFVDNAHHSVTKFIENLVFPDGIYEEYKSCRETMYYALYTCYAELHPTEDSMQSPCVAELVSLVKFWLDRSPLLDIHVNVFLLVKKAESPFVCNPIEPLRDPL